MLKRTQFGLRLLPLMLVAGMMAVSAPAQVVNSGASPIALQAVLQDSITLTISASAVNFTLTAGSANNPGNTTIVATTTWTLDPNIHNVKLYAFFSNSAAALSDGGGDNIPSADFQISANGGAFTALTNTVPFGGANAGMQISSTPILGTNKNGSHSDSMNFNINLAPLPNLPAGTYTGTLTLQAQAI